MAAADSAIKPRVVLVSLTEDDDFLFLLPQLKHFGRQFDEEQLVDWFLVFVDNEEEFSVSIVVVMLLLLLLFKFMILLL